MLFQCEQIMSTLWFCLFVLPGKSMMIVKPKYWTYGLLVDHNSTGPNIDSDWAIQMDNAGYTAYFTIGLTFYNKTSDVIYGVTSGHNLCNDMAEPLYTKTSNQTLISDPPYQYEIYNADCAMFKYDETFFEADQLINKSGLNPDTALDISNYKIYEDPPIGYAVEKYGASTGYTTGSILFWASYTGQQDSTCNSTKTRFETVFYIQSDDEGGKFAKPGDCGSLVYNSKDQVIIGFIVAGYEVGDETEFALVVPYKYWLDYCGIQSFPTYTEPFLKSRKFQQFWNWSGWVLGGIAFMTTIYCWICRKIEKRRLLREMAEQLHEDEQVPFNQEKGAIITR